MADYLNMLNERDGGIGGVKLVVEECETEYDAKKGVECDDKVKVRTRSSSIRYSTGITLELIQGSGRQIPSCRWPRLSASATARSSHGSSIRLPPTGTGCR